MEARAQAMRAVAAMVAAMAEVIWDVADKEVVVMEAYVVAVAERAAVEEASVAEAVAAVVAAVVARAVVAAMGTADTAHLRAQKTSCSSLHVSSSG